MVVDDAIVYPAVEIGHQYARDVMGGRILACRYVTQVCRRHLYDLDNPRGFYFDAEDADDALTVAGWVVLFKGKQKGRAFDPPGWMCFLLISIFGWKRADGTRRYRQVYLEVARKQAKTHLAIIIALILCFFDGEGGAEGYIALPGGKEQAKKSAWDIACKLVKNSPVFNDRLEVFKERILFEGDHQFLCAVSHVANLQDGFETHFFLADELHEHPDRDLLDTIEEGSASRPQPLTMCTTTAGGQRSEFCREMREGNIQLLQRFEDGESWASDDSILPYIATLDDGDDWKDPSNYIKANPSLNLTVSLEYLTEKLEKVTGTSGEINFRRKNLNQWLQTDNTWLPEGAWAKAGAKYDADSLLGRQCFAGLDLSSSHDLTALVLLFPGTSGEPARLLCYAWLPEATVDRRRDRVPYRSWADRGYLSVTPGDQIDFDFVELHILDLARRFDIRAIAYDSFLSRDLVPRLEGHGLPMVVFPQTFSAMGPAVKRTELEILGGRLQHNHNPLFNWTVGNVKVEKNAGGLSKLSKKISTGRIDPAVCTVMAEGLIMDNEADQQKKKSVYETRGLVRVKRKRWR